ncbi:MAG: motility protein A [Pirellulaceae bacterium]|jgi:chemotaxis protein MotA|nr:motility protein A [Pirellulaceae bacterium]MDP7016069.1 motility protein A [Pirellulaceae bacterium]
MDIASLVGLLLAFGLIIGSIAMGQAPFSAFIDVPSGLVVIGGAIAAALIAFPLKDFLTVPMVVKKVMLNKAPDCNALIEQIVSLAETARRDGLLALEGRMDDIEDPFIKMGIQMAVDGTRPEVIEDIMRTEIASAGTRHKNGKGLMDQMGRFAPAYGMIGTLMGLIMMLSDMSDPSGIGAGMAVALITTLYGAIVANVIFIPFAEKLGFINKQELTAMEITLRGVMAIQSGENPRVIEQKLATFLPPKVRAAREEAA